MKNDQDILVILTPGFPANERDDTCLPFLQNLIKAFNKNFPAVTLVILTFQYPFAATQYFWNNNRVISLGGRERGKIARRYLWLKAWRTLLRLRKSSHIRGLLSIWLGECALLGKHFGKKYTITHKTWVVGQDARPGNKFIGKIKPVGADLIAISDSVANELFTSYLIVPGVVIPNGIDSIQFKKGTPGRPIDIIGAGSLIILKQYQVFIEIVSKLGKKYPRINSCIAGNGPEKESLHRLVSELQLAENVSLPGEMDHGTLLALMQQSKIFLHPSLYEGFSMACLEGLYAGCHVISFCKPMDKDLEHWHVVATKEEMSAKALEILNFPGTDYTSIFPYSVDESAIAMLRLFR